MTNVEYVLSLDICIKCGTDEVDILLLSILAFAKGAACTLSESEDDAPLEFSIRA